MANRQRPRSFWLVHGYNVDEQEARAAYAWFRAHLRRVSATAAAETIDVLWPGDAWTPFLRTFAYPFKPTVAKRAGRLLGEVLSARRRRDDREHLVIVAHSLGCRLALEAAAHLDAGLRPITVILMAAAVPVDLVQRGRDMRRAIVATTRPHVLFSPWDRVLRLAFPAGQTVAPGERGRLPEAIGLRGRPRFLWSSRAEMRQYGHGSYWKTSRTVAKVAKAVGLPAKRELEPLGGAPAPRLVGRQIARWRIRVRRRRDPTVR